MDIITRKEAMQRGLLRYFTGKPCPHGHVAERFVSSYGCVECTKEHSKRYYHENPLKYNAITQEWRSKNQEHLKQYRKLSYKKNKDYYAQKGRAWRKKNADRVKEYNKLEYGANKEAHKKRALAWRTKNLSRHKRNQRRWMQENKGRVNSLIAKRKAAKMKRTPVYRCQPMIDLFYKEARRISEETGIPHHVDHIIPLQGALVSGLHTASNLQILTAIENMRKHNHFDPDSFDG